MKKTSIASPTIYIFIGLVLLCISGCTSNTSSEQENIAPTAKPYTITVAGKNIEINETKKAKESKKSEETKAVSVDILGVYTPSMFESTTEQEESEKIIFQSAEECTKWAIENAPEELYTNYYFFTGLITSYDNLEVVEMTGSDSRLSMKINADGEAIGLAIFEWDNTDENKKTVEIVCPNFKYTQLLFTIELYSTGKDLEGRDTYEMIERMLEGETIDLDGVSVSSNLVTLNISY